MNYLLSRRASRRARRSAAVVALVAAGGFVVAALYQACAIYDTSLLSPGDAGADTPATTSTVCGIIQPARPAADDPSSTDFTFVVAMQSVDVGVGVGPDGGIADGGDTGPLPPRGWDLDGVCTCPGPSSCVQPDGSDNCDDSVGRDNTGVKIFRVIGAAAQQGNATANQAMQAGLYGILIQVTGYNGQANDRQVTVSIFASNGVLGADGGPNTLRHNGTDRWTIDPRYLASQQQSVGTDCGSSACPPEYTQTNAYVAGGVLVATFDSVPLTFGGRANIGGAEMNLYSLLLVGTLTPRSIQPTGESWAIDDGTLSGRWKTSDLLSNMATIPDFTNDAGQFLCGNDPAYEFIKNSTICKLRDIDWDSTQDNLGASCNAISMSLGFTAEPALLGVVTPPPTVVYGCVPDGGGTFYDDCP